MAERRMFAKSIIDSDAFLDMPLSSQALYFHLSMRADDEGFVNNPNKIRRMINASDDDFKLLMAKKFILFFDSGVVVIKHWRIHNYIRGDRLSETNYREERASLAIDENGSYTNNKLKLVDENNEKNQDDAECQADDSQMTDKCQHRLGKVRLGKVRLGKETLLTETFDLFWDAYPKKVGKDAARKSWIKISDPEKTIKTILDALAWQVNLDQWNRNDGQYIPNPSTYLNQGRWLDQKVVVDNTLNKHGRATAEAAKRFLNGDQDD
jgi:hypothetical protein